MRKLKLALIALPFLALAGCPKPYDAGWRTVAAVQSAGNAADDALARVGRAKHEECSSKHAQGSTEYSDCVAKERTAITYWVNYVRPAINTALLATVSGLQVAEKVKTKPDYDWKEELKPAVCLLAKVLEQWAPLFGKYADTIKAFLGAAKGFSCP